MSRQCRTCSRLNPMEASFCFFDGAWLGGAGDTNGPLAIGAMPFPAPFVFPTGRVCRNFDELALGCEAEWEEAQKLLGNGFFEGFLAGLGRADLGQSARRAQGNADRDRGLDQFLTSLPGDAREAARLVVQPREINLGHLVAGETRRMTLHFENAGMGLLHGSAAVEDSDWLLLGDGTGSPRKVFQFRHDFTLPAQIIGKRVRASSRKLEAQIVVETNGGTQIVIIRGEVPLKPFALGVLAGATTPRQIAEKAKENPMEAAALFESGAVDAWYKSNGWVYPVQGPSASGVGAVQQFFEALGLAKPPRVEISHRVLNLIGPPGATLDETIQVRTVEKRPVFAHAVSDVPWLKIQRIQLDGRTAYIPVQVPMVPVRPGEQMRATIHLTANGNQRFAIETILTVQGTPAGSRERRALAANLPVAEIDESRQRRKTKSKSNAVLETAIVEALVADDEVQPAATTRFLKSLVHLLPLLVLLLALAGTLAHDLKLPADVLPHAESVPFDPNPYLAFRFHDGPDPEKILPAATMRFGLSMLREHDPDNPRRPKQLTFDDRGRTNNTCLRIDGEELLFGEQRGEWVKREDRLRPDATGRNRDGMLSSWIVRDKQLRVVQRVEIVPGETSGRLDTCQVRYILENLDGRPHDVGIRFLLDTFIGANDGVPFTIPGSPGLCDTKMDLGGNVPLPDFIQALEKDDLSKPGSVAHLQFRLGGHIEAPSRVTLGGWPNASLRHFGFPNAAGELTKWDVPLMSIDELQRQARKIGKSAVPDSAVVIYWPEKMLQPGEQREVGFSYGLGDVASGEGGGRLLLSLGGRLVRDGAFTLTALVRNPQLGEKLNLTVPDGFVLLDGDAEQAIPPVPAGASRPTSPVTWRIRARKEGQFVLQVQSSAGAGQKLPLTIRNQGIFD